ncbi:MAG: Chromate resistance protein ChrB [Ilumatobacteraceae bacterium]
MMQSARAEKWVVIIPRLPSEPSRYRVAVWRELRRAGAVQLGQGTWTLPDITGTAAEIAKIAGLVAESGGEVLVLAAKGWGEPDAALVRARFDEARRAEWTEFASECDKALAELRSEIAKQKFTLAELDEEEQNVERLRRWHRELSVRDAFGAADPAEMQARLDDCTAALTQFTELVYAALGMA